MKHTRYLKLMIAVAVAFASITLSARAEENTPPAPPAGVQSMPPGPGQENENMGRPDLNRQQNGDRKNILEQGREGRKGIASSTMMKIRDVRAMGTSTGTSTRGMIRDLREGEREDMMENREATIEALKANMEKRFEANKTQVEARKKQLTLDLQKRKGEKKQKLDANAKQRVLAQSNMIFTALSNQISRLIDVDARVSVRINATTTPPNVNISAVKTQYSIAQSALSKAKTDVDAAKALVTDQTNTGTSSTTIKTLIKTAEGSIKNAGEQYRKTLELLHPEDRDLFASSTPAKVDNQATTTP